MELEVLKARVEAEIANTQNSEAEDSPDKTTPPGNCLHDISVENEDKLAEGAAGCPDGFPPLPHCKS